MGLSLALNTARSSLQASSSQMAVISRNTAGATDPSYSRKVATLITGGGMARVTVSRASDAALFFKMLGTTSTAAGQQAVLSGLERLSQTVGDTALNKSPAAQLSALNSALLLYANKPDNLILARSVIDQATTLATTLNEATGTVQKVREEADAAIAESVSRVKDLLGQFETLNKAVIKGTAAGIDISDELDARDNILAQLSEEMGINVVTRENNDMAIYTDSGVALFDKTPREISFTQTYKYSAVSPVTVGSAVVIDGVPVTGSSPMPLHAGRLVGLVSVRDEITVQYQGQLDEIARGLIEIFAEADQSPPPVDVSRTGLFTYGDSSTVPGPALPDPTLKGLAGLITVSSRIDPTKGGDPERLRDGGVNGADYTYNPGSNAAFAERLSEIAGKLVADRTFDPATGLGSTMNIQVLAQASAGWLEASRKTASASADYQTTLLGHASDALSNATGVNMDDETALMLQIEKSYSASAKLISVINEMLRVLLNTVG